MRKFIVITVLGMLAVSCGMFRKIEINTSSKGERQILTCDRNLFDGMKVALGARISGRDTVLAVLVSTDESSNHGIFDRDDKFQIRFSDDKVIELSNIYDREFEKETTTGVSETPRTDFGYAYTYDPYYDAVVLTPYTITQMVPHSYSTTRTTSYALYLISKNQLEDITGKEIIKLRIETDSDYRDMQSPARVSRTFETLYRYLREAYANDPKKVGEF